MYDIFIISANDEHIKKVRSQWPLAKVANSVEEAQKKALTRFLWVVWETTLVHKSFKFEYKVPEWDAEFLHIFKSTNDAKGICLLSKQIDWKTAERKELDIVASVAIPYDIVFISNGEPQAEEHWEWLQDVTYRLPNKLHRVQGVNGRVAAYQAAANLSETATFFAVFAKIKVNEDFDWSWTGSAFDEKHYIFMAENPVNGLVYGHQAVIAYHKRLVLENDGSTIDFTLKQPHEVVNMLSGVAHYNTSPKLAWRTAFREALKLKLFSETKQDEEARGRLSVWLAPSDVPYGSWSQIGARDAVEYFDAVGGAHDKLMLSFEWKWLDEYFTRKHNGLD